MQHLTVIVLVSAAAVYVLWSLSGRGARLAMLSALERVLPILRAVLAPVRRRLEQPSGCAACSSSPAQGRHAGRSR